MPDRILVTGATGELGRELVRLLVVRGEVVRAATRFPTEARRLFGEDVEVVELDYDATETYDAAAMWVDRLFLMPPPFDPHAHGTLVPFLDWCVASGVGKVVLLSAMGIEDRPDLPLHRLERHLERLNIAATHLRPNLYMQNFTGGLFRDGIRDRGSIEVCAGEGRVSFVDARDVAAVAAACLTEATHDGRTFTLTGPESIGFADAAATIGRAMGRPVGYTAVSSDRMREILTAAHWPVAQAKVAVELFEAVARGVREPTHDDLPGLLGRPPVSFDAFATSNVSAWA